MTVANMEGISGPDLTCTPSSRTDPAPPPPSPTPGDTSHVTHIVIREPLEERQQDIKTETASILIPSSTATLDLLQETSKTLRMDVKHARLLSTSPASPASLAAPDVCVSATPKSPRQLFHPDSDKDTANTITSSPPENNEDAIQDEIVNKDIVLLPQEQPVETLPSTVVEERVIEDTPGQYRLKWIKFRGNKIPIITQNENGPCPLIAIMNVLLLKGKLRLASHVDVVTSEQLMEYLGDCILASLPSNLTEAAQLNFEQNMMDAIAILPKLQTGLDVNVRFSSISDFEFTPELIVFDLLHIPLHHGWLIDPVNFKEMASVVGSCSYNQLVDKIINNKSSNKTQLVTEGELVVVVVVVVVDSSYLLIFFIDSLDRGRVSRVNSLPTDLLWTGPARDPCQGRRSLCVV